MNLLRWHHPVVRQWAGTMLAVLALAVLASALRTPWRTDLAFYDAASSGGEAPDDVVIVAVDDASIAALGRWPWRRARHAALLERLHAMGARAVALDFLFTEPDAESAADDAALAEAMRRGPPTVLPLFVVMAGLGNVEERWPIPILAQAAAGIGHANLELDRDGIARSVFLREGLGAPNRLHLAATLLEAAPGAAPLRLRGARHPDLAGAPRVWVRDFQMFVPFLGPPGHFMQVSYADVLRGDVPAAQIRGKYVLVGATAQGVGDAYPTPLSGGGRTMAGVEVNANILQALRSDTAIRPLSRWLAALLSAVPVSLAGVGLLLLPPRRSWLLCLLLMLITAGGSALALRHGGWWFPPSASLIALLALYPLWSWRRLEAMQTFLEEEFERLSREQFPVTAMGAAQLRPLDFVERRMELLRQATQRMREVRRLFADLVNGLPDATILADATGAIVLANPAAAALFGQAGSTLEDTPLDAQLFERVKDEALRYQILAARAPCTVEASLEHLGRHVLVRAVPFGDSAALRAGTIIALADITELRIAQRERDDLLRFLSHDMKSPASSLLGLAQLQRDPHRALPPLELSRRIDVLALRLLTLVDGFVALTRAESADPGEFKEFDLRDAVQDACDEIWATAQARGIRLDTCQPEDAMMVNGDRQLLARAIVNLLSNALKFSPAGATVDLRCSRFGREAMLEVSDQGPGIALEHRASLFRRFSRGLHRGEADPGGAGLGLAFVRVVMEKHAGRAWVDGGSEHGAVFSVSMPCTMDDAGA